MKRLALLSLLVPLLVLLLAIPVLAAGLYSADITISDTSVVDRTGVPVLVPLGVAQAVELGYLTASGLDSRVFEGTTERLYMLANDKLGVLVPILLASQERIYRLETGYDPPNTSFGLITGTGGYVTISDDAALELGNNFEIELSGWIDTASGADKNLIYKAGAFTTDVSSAEEITSTVTDSFSPSYYSSNSDGDIYVANVTYSTAQAAASGTVDAGSTTFTIGQSLETGFPTVAAVTGGNTKPGDTSHTVNLPSGVVSGNLLLIFFISDGNPTISFPGGWTQLFQKSDGGFLRFGAWYRVADGGEGASITVTTSASEETGYTSYRITGFIGTPQCGTAATGTSTNPDPPNLAPSWGAKNTLWFAVCGYDNDYMTKVSAYPSSYTNGRDDYWTSNDGCGLGSARRNLNAANENPGTFTISNSEQWIANTVAVYGTYYQVDKGYVYFDTSPIPDDVTILSADLKLYGQADNSATDFDITVQSGMPTYPTDPLAAGDFNKTHYSDDGGSLTTVGLDTSGYNTIELNATGIGWINKTGVTKFCIRSSRDIAVTTPTGDEYVSVYASEQTGTDRDPVLVVTYTIEVSVTATGVASGEHTVKTTADGTNLKIYVDDVEEDSTALSGASVSDNANNWLLMQNDCVSFLEYYKHTVSGTLIAWYQPAAIISGTTLPDREGAAQNGAITWGTNSDLSVEAGGLTSISSYVSESTEEGEPPIVLPLPDTDLIESEDAANLPWLPASLVDPASAGLDWSRNTLYSVLLLFGCIALGAGVAIATSSALLAMIAVGVALAVCVGTGVVGWWVVIVYAIFGSTYVVASRSM